jgi:hypothetical protein
MKKSLLSLCSLFVCHFLNAQSVPYLLNNEAVYHQIDRFEVLYGNDNALHTSVKPYTRANVMRYVLSLDSLKGRMSKVDQAALQYLYDDNNELLTPSELPTTITGKQEPMITERTPQYTTNKKPILKYFFRTPANLYETHTKYFDLKINPILQFNYGRERGDDQPLFLNQRGVEIRGSVDNRVYFQSNIIETQARFADYVTARIIRDSAIQGAALYKTYNSIAFPLNSSYDYVNAQGLIGFNLTPHIGLQLGNGQNFAGDGMRSIFLSNFANNYFFLKLKTKVWKFEYQNTFAELHINNRPNDNNALNVKKYMATHQLSFNVNSNLNFGIFETVIMTRSTHFELQYLNPIIFYRSVEHNLGSPDNVLLGANFKWNVAKRLSFYGQGLLDEFLFKELFVNNKGWWANKYAAQIGVKYFNALNIDHLDMQAEFNKVRPFTYSYYDNERNYTHAFQSLAHPLGSNFTEIMAKIRYQPTWKLIFDARLMYVNAGENKYEKVNGTDVLKENFGNIPLVPNELRKREYGYYTTEGVNAKTLLTSLDVSYQFHHNMFADLHILARKKDSQDPNNNERTFYFGGGVRLNFGTLRNDF